MGQKQYVYEDLNSLDDESLGSVLSSCLIAYLRLF